MICHCVTKFNDNLDFVEITFFSQKKARCGVLFSMMFALPGK